VALANAQGVETKAEITFSDLQNVKAQLATALEPGEYTLKVYTRSGLGDQFGVHVASRKVVVE
jgi:dUTPase